VERTYQSCDRDGMSSTYAGDWCWTDYRPLTLMLNGQSTRILWDASSGWKTENDSLGWRFESMTGAGNGVWNGEYWRITTGDGTQYLFGSRPRALSGGALRAVVHGNNSGEPCYNATFANAQCWMGYRWNLDQVIDRHGNTITYNWFAFTGKYGSANNAVALEYDLWGILTGIDYGKNTAVANSRDLGRVAFNLEYRCTSLNHSTCDTPGNEWMWPDSPRDQYCATSLTSCPGLKYQAFWSPWRLQSVDTKVWSVAAGDWALVDNFALVQAYPSTLDMISPWGQDDTSPALWLASVQRTGWPAVTFGAPNGPLINRVQWGDDISVPPSTYYRITDVWNGYGEHLRVAYSGQDCSRTSLPSNAGSNSRRCYPPPRTPTAGSGITPMWSPTSPTPTGSGVARMS
jgi:hypothetical protein